MTLEGAILRALSMRGDSNAIGLTLTPEVGWGTSYGQKDRRDGEILILNQESLMQWARGFSWTPHQVQICAEWIMGNLGEWIRNQEKYAQLMEAAR